MKYKILLLNLGYFSGLNGSIFDYIFKSYRYVFPSKKIIGKISEKLKEIIFREKPDVICLIEIRKSQIKYLANENYKFYDFETKYSPNGLARKTPILKDQCNGFLSKEKINFQKFFLKNGSKKLVYIINFPGEIKLILFHFALGKNTRKKQFEEIKTLAGKDKKTIICGDFNISKGMSELNSLINDTNLEICQKEPTFPAYNPKKAIDLFLVSSGLAVKLKVIRSDVSDHLPVLLEIEV